MSSFKITSPDQKLARRLRFPSPRPSYATLTAKILSLWGSAALMSTSLGLSYVDRDGDRCVLSSDEELGGLYDELAEDGKEGEVVKLRVVVLGDGEGGQGGPGGEGLLVEEGEGAKVEQTDGPAAAVVSEVLGEERALDDDDETSLVAVAATEPDVQPAPSPEIPAVATSPPPTIAATADDAQAVPAAPASDASDASDPPDEFPTGASAAPPPAPPQPSLFADLSSLFSSVAGSPALSALLARAASGAYTPSLASAVHSHAGSAATQAAAAQAELERVLGQVHVQLQGSGLGAVDGKLREVEAAAAGWTAKVREGLKEVQQLAEQRQAAAAAASTAAAGADPTSDAQPAQTQQADVEMDAGPASAAASTAEDTTPVAAAPSPAMPGAFTPPVTSLIDGFARPQPAPAPAQPSAAAMDGWSLHAPAVPPYATHNQFSPPPGPPPPSSFAADNQPRSSLLDGFPLNRHASASPAVVDDHPAVRLAPGAFPSPAPAQPTAPLSFGTAPAPGTHAHWGVRDSTGAVINSGCSGDGGGGLFGVNQSALNPRFPIFLGHTRDVPIARRTLETYTRGWAPDRAEEEYQRRSGADLRAPAPLDNGAGFRWRRFGQDGALPGSFPEKKAPAVVKQQSVVEGGWASDQQVEGLQGGADTTPGKALAGALAKLTEMGLMDDTLLDFLRGVQAVAPLAAVSELVLAGLKYHAHGPAANFFERPEDARPAARADGRSVAEAHQETFRRLAEVGLEQGCFVHLVNGQLAVNPALDVDAVTTTTLGLVFE